ARAGHRGSQARRQGRHGWQFLPAGRSREDSIGLLTLPRGAGFKLRVMARDGLLIGEVAARSGVSRKALRLYEAAGILPAPRRTAARYRVYGSDTLALLAFVTQARRLGFTLGDIKRSSPSSDRAVLRARTSAIW